MAGSSRQWSVYVRLAADVRPEREEHADALGAVAALLDDRHRAAVSAAHGDIDAQAWAEGSTPAAALEVVRAALADAAERAGVPAGDVVRQSS